MTKSSQELNYSQEHEAFVTAVGTPFATERAASTFATKNNIDEPEIITIGNGFGVKGRVIPQIDKPAGPPPDEKYYRVRFNDKGSPTDPDLVELHVNFETLVVQRGKEVVIPARFKECAEHGNHPIYKQSPGQTRKIAGHQDIFPFSVLGEGTKEEYLKQKAEGSRKTQADFRKNGFDVKPMDD